jgi:hypothetical protein
MIALRNDFKLVKKGSIGKSSISSFSNYQSLAKESNNTSLLGAVAVGFCYDIYLAYVNVFDRNLKDASSFRLHILSMPAADYNEIVWESMKITRFIIIGVVVFLLVVVGIIFFFHRKNSNEEDPRYNSGVHNGSTGIPILDYGEPGRE